MDAATWRWAKELVADALKLPESDRGAFLRARCSDEDVRSEIHSLLHRYGDSVGLGGSTVATLGHSFDELQFAPGRVFAGRYRVVSFLGRGGMGEVYRADDLKLEQPVALKFLPAAFASDPQRLARFTAEVRIARTVSHPNVCRVFDIGESEGLHYLSMEYIDGDDLASLLRRVDRLHPAKAIDIARQLCDGLAAAHERGVLHRDLKPANVLIDGRGRARIVDFGLAMTPVAGSPSEIAGTPAYMAPEQFSGGPLTPQTDIFSLGMVIYELFTGRRSSNGGNPHDPAVPAIVAACLQNDPADRPRAASVVADGLRAPSSASTEMRARVGELEGRLAPPVALLALLSIVAGAIAIASVVATFRAADLPNSPEVLAARARSVLADAGFPADRRDSEFSFVSVEAQQVRFLYRQSRSYLLPRNLFRVVTEDDPPEDVPGMTTVVLDPRGQLLRLSGIPSFRSGEVASAPPWAKLFADAALDEHDFVQTDAVSAIPTAHDKAVFWRRETAAGALHVVGATQNGRVVFFDVNDPNTAAPLHRNLVAGPRSPVVEALLWTFIGLAFVTSGILARRALVGGHVDRVVAGRLAAFTACGAMTFGLLRAHHVPIAVEEAVLLLGLGGWVLVWTAFTWLAYVGMEPHVRRTWPKMLVSFGQFAKGRLRDPIVGLHVLVGLLAGLVVAGIVRVSILVARRPPPEIVVYTALQGLHSSRHFVAWLLFHLTDSLQFALIGVLFLVILRLIVRNSWIAAAVWVALVAPMGIGSMPLSGSASFGWSLLLLVSMPAVGLFVVLRFGLLAALVMLVTDRLLTQMPITLDFDAWYFGSSVATLLLLGALAIYGFIVALGGRPLFADPAPRPSARA